MLEGYAWNQANTVGEVAFQRGLRSGQTLIQGFRIFKIIQ